jgi:hypothetical protein
MSKAFALAPLCAPPFEIAESVAALLKTIRYLIESDEDRLAFRGGQRQDRLSRVESPFDLPGELGIADEVCESPHELVPNRNAREHHGQESMA